MTNACSSDLTCMDHTAPVWAATYFFPWPCARSFCNVDRSISSDMRQAGVRNSINRTPTSDNYKQTRQTHPPRVAIRTSKEPTVRPHEPLRQCCCSGTLALRFPNECRPITQSEHSPLYTLLQTIGTGLLIKMEAKRDSRQASAQGIAVKHAMNC